MNKNQSVNKSIKLLEYWLTYNKNVKTIKKKKQDFVLLKQIYYSWKFDIRERN